MDIYREKGYKDRKDYVTCLADKMGVPRQMAYLAADILGTAEDFDGLISMLEDLPPEEE